MTIYELRSGDSEDLALTKAEYEALSLSDPRPWPEPVNRLLQAIREAPDETWRSKAACKGMTHLFYPEGTSRSNYTRAAKICATCPVVAECSEAGRYEAEGFWGGDSPLTRSRRRRDEGMNPNQYPPHVRAEAMELAANGMSDAQVARRLSVHVRTVQTWRRAVGMAKDNHGRLVA